MRKRLWQLHSWLGLIAGLGLLVIGLTGSLLVFHDELEAVIFRGLIRVEPKSSGRQPLDVLRTAAERQLTGYEITGWLVRRDEPNYADVLYVMRHGSSEWLVATLDPFTGRLLADPRKGTTTVTGWLIELHSAFFGGHVGLLLAGLLAALLLALGSTGIWLYREFWKHLLTLRWRRGARLLFSDLHKFVGITSLGFNLILGFTGAYWNLVHVAGEWTSPEEKPWVMERRLYAEALSLDALVNDATRRLPGFQTNFISLPSSGSTPSTVTLWGAVMPHPPLRSDYGSTLTYDAITGRHQATSDLRQAGLWAQITDSFRPLHFGTFGGLGVKLLWCLGGLAPGGLAITGFAIWWLRQRRRVKEKRSGALEFVVGNL